MTDLKNGIIEINGFEINPNTTSFDIINNLKNVYSNRAVSKDGSCELFRFDVVRLLDKHFKVKITFVREKINNVQLFSLYGAPLTYEERFKADCEWLKSILGKPDEIHDDGNSYYCEGRHIYSFIQRDLSRNPAETFIVCKYNG